MNRLSSRLRNEFQDVEYRRTYVDDFLNVAIASQIRALREQRGWSQEDLARVAGMKQSRISTMENVNYGSWSIKTLLKLAKAFDVALGVRFESFGERINEMERFSIEGLNVPSFAEDPSFRVAPASSMASLATAVSPQPTQEDQHVDALLEALRRATASIAQQKAHDPDWGRVTRREQIDPLDPLREEAELPGRQSNRQLAGVA